MRSSRTSRIGSTSQFCCAGLNFGYFYDRSPIVVGDGEAAPAYTMGTFTASTVFGGRAPHFRLADGRSLYGAFGPGYTLLRCDPAVEAGALTAGAAARRVALEVIDVPSAQAPDAYRHKLVRCRSDQHIAWRGDAVPIDPGRLIDVLRGVREP